MPPRRDAFALALNALRHRLRQGVDAPGDALPIQTIADDLRLSTTPVREALSRLAGERLVDKRGPTYTRPRPDGPTLAALYDLRLVYLTAALGRRIERRDGVRRAPLELLAVARAQAVGAGAAAMVEALFLDLMRGGGDGVLFQAYQPLADRLAPFAALEDVVLQDVGQDASALVAAVRAGRTAELRRALRRHHRVRMTQAAQIARLADGERYRTDMI
ncbi:hypothetical protein ASD38_16740 [Caulobacter sp. Root487D2Y]|uniref:GntR family transcriptional regulator n=1 Tax=Caulobacter sp. Root487D2Y TaxID=1736547 RepID=UPI0006FB0189|nr:GntR family transcriptional regulator [Caulobacter sp. Root487D2Y]KQY28327.1 hypothetical protein ASD38_16740 [Caulobacter sp. Root487D2Y]